ncbi:unnamed protein product [Peniophora sp. CBMAI 1063]|nr:unnamed protein product [Peniophora sp. CBMAI 1063]
MGMKDILASGLTQPGDLRVLAQYWLFSNQRRSAPQSSLTNTRRDQKTMQRCWELLDTTNKNASYIVKELDGELARVMCLFYVILGALDTIMDDRALAEEDKQSLLRSFHEKVVTPGWSFTGNGPNAKGRVILTDFANVVEEIAALDSDCRNIIVDICQKREIGMADYANLAAASGEILISTLEDYDMYCHYMAGLTSEGLSRIFSATGKEAPWLADELELSNSVGFLLHKANIIRGFRTDVDSRRLLWPREVWADPKFGNGASISTIAQLYAPGQEARAAWVQTVMVMDALQHAPDTLDYLRFLRDPTVFRFVAVSAVMAMGTLELCFMNPEMFHKTVELRVAQVARFTMEPNSMRDVAYLFRDLARAIHAKLSPKDPNFIPLAVSTSKIEQWAEHYYPSFVPIVQGRSRSHIIFNANARDPQTALGQAIDDQVSAEKTLSATAGART